VCIYIYMYVYIYMYTSLIHVHAQERTRAHSHAHADGIEMHGSHSDTHLFREDAKEGLRRPHLDVFDPHSYC